MLNLLLFLLLLLGVKETTAGGSRHSGGGSSNLNRRYSHDFVIPDPTVPAGSNCLRYSRHFCLMRLWFSTQQKERVALENDTVLFEQMVRHMYTELNWYSFRDADIGGCCGHQVSSYVDFGQRLGLSPAEYLNKLCNLGVVEHKKLVYVKLWAHIDNDFVHVVGVLWALTKQPNDLISSCCYRNES
ncbi:uncharacterized protein LOC142349056 [Convolutriloba macropyga]|uniref:uncharacterized protein LOC142349056 n=1 Tax=Convolutriloba macropyga TaxID=536237 RepID=UPI003F51EA97